MLFIRTHHGVEVWWWEDFPHLHRPPELVEARRTVDLLATELGADKVRQLLATRSPHNIQQLTDEQVLAELAEHLHRGSLKLAHSPTAYSAVSLPEEKQAPPPPPPAPPPRKAESRPQPAPEVLTFVPTLDPMALADALRSASDQGVPFCEECEKKKAALSAGGGNA